MNEYKFIAEIEIDIWKAADNEGALANLVEEVIWDAVAAAKGSGKVEVVKDVDVEIIPDFDDDRSVQKVQVILFHVPAPGTHDG